jgi:hypothetical protein
LIVVKDGNTDIVVELEPVKGKPGEYVNYQNKKEVYTKTADGRFEKKTSSQTQIPIKFLGKNKYKKAVADAQKKGIAIMSEEEVNKLLIK